MTLIENSIFIKASPEKVFSHITNLEGQKNQYVTSVEADGPLKLGAKIKTTVKAANGTVNVITSEVVGFEKNKLYSVKTIATPPASDMVSTNILEAEKGGTKLILSRQPATGQIWLAEPGGGWHFDLRGEVEHILDKDRTTVADAVSTLFDLGLNYRRRLANSWDIRADFDLGRQETGTLNANGADVSDRLRLALTADKGDGTVLGASLERNTADLVAANADNRHKRASVYWQTRPAWLKDGSLKLEYADYIHTFTENAANDYREKIVKLSLQWNFQKEAKK